MHIFKRFNINTSKREARPGQTLDANIINVSFEEITQDLNELANRWNKFFVPLLGTLPNGTQSGGGIDLIDAFTTGLNGKTIYSNAAATGTNIHYNIDQARPKTIFEELDSLFTSVTSINSAIAALQISAAGGITAAQKAAIGDHIFDATKSSSGTSLEGKITTLGNNIIQVAKDLYGTDYSLSGTTNSLLIQSVKGMINALLVLHNGAWTNQDTIDIELSHSTLPEFTPIRTFIGQSSPEVTQPNYSSNSIVTQGANLTTAIGQLDAAASLANAGINNAQGRINNILGDIETINTQITNINGDITTLQSAVEPVYFTNLQTTTYTAHANEIVIFDPPVESTGTICNLPSAQTCEGKTITIRILGVRTPTSLEIRPYGVTDVVAPNADAIEYVSDTNVTIGAYWLTPNGNTYEHIPASVTLMSIGAGYNIQVGEEQVPIRWIMLDCHNFTLPG